MNLFRLTCIDCGAAHFETPRCDKCEGKRIGRREAYADLLKEVKARRETLTPFDIWTELDSLALWLENEAPGR